MSDEQSDEMSNPTQSPTTPETSEAAPAVAEAPAGDAVPTYDLESEADLEARIVEAVKTVYDPEIPVDVYELGLIYDIHQQGDGNVEVRMTLTSPACPVAGSLPGEVEQKVQGVDGVEKATVELVWDPPWNPGMMSEAAKLELGMF